MATTKCISIDQLTVGMFISALDQPWYRTPFLLHKWLVSNPDDIVQLKRHGIHVVTIDTERGLDVGTATTPALSGFPPPVEPPPANTEAVASQQNNHSPQAAAAVAYREAMAAVARVFHHLISDFFPKPGDVVAVKEQHLREYPVNALFRVERADSFGWVTSESGHTFKKERLRKATEYEITAFNTKEHNERH